MLSVKMSNTHEAAVGNEQMQRKTKKKKEKLVFTLAIGPENAQALET